MSNLKLPIMSYGNLNRLAGNRVSKRVAYNTNATAYDGHVAVYYHNNFIGEVWQGGVYLNTAGWNTQTTTNRLNRMLVDNLPGTPYRVGIRNGEVCLVSINDKKARVPFRDVLVYDDGTIVQEQAWKVSIERMQGQS